MVVYFPSRNYHENSKKLTVGVHSVALPIRDVCETKYFGILGISRGMKSLCFITGTPDISSDITNFTTGFPGIYNDITMFTTGIPKGIEYFTTVYVFLKTLK